MTPHEEFVTRTRDLASRAGIRFFGLRSPDCSFVHPHDGPCQPREPGGYRAADGWRESGLIVR